MDRQEAPPQGRGEEWPPQGRGEGRSEVGAGYLQKDPYFFFFDVMLTGRESQRQVDDDGENDRADDANGRTLCVDGDRRERSGGERDDGDDDGCLSNWLRFYFEGEFH